MLSKLTNKSIIVFLRFTKIHNYRDTNCYLRAPHCSGSPSLTCTVAGCSTGWGRNWSLSVSAVCSGACIAIDLHSLVKLGRYCRVSQVPGTGQLSVFQLRCPTADRTERCSENPREELRKVTHTYRHIRNNIFSMYKKRHSQCVIKCYILNYSDCSPLFLR